MNPFEYLKSIQAKWAWESYCMSMWHKIPIIGSTKNKFVLSALISTGGLSDHEQIIENIDKLFWDGFPYIAVSIIIIILYLIITILWWLMSFNDDHKTTLISVFISQYHFLSTAFKHII